MVYLATPLLSCYIVILSPIPLPIGHIKFSVKIWPTFMVLAVVNGTLFWPC